MCVVADLASVWVVSVVVQINIDRIGNTVDDQRGDTCGHLGGNKARGQLERRIDMVVLVVFAFDAEQLELERRQEHLVGYEVYQV